MLPEAEINTAEVIWSNFQFWLKSDLLVAVMFPEAEMNTAEVILSNFSFGQKVIC